MISFQPGLDHVDVCPLTPDVFPFLITNKDAAEESHKVGAFEQLEIDSHWRIELFDLVREEDLPTFVLLGDRLCLCTF